MAPRRLQSLAAAVHAEAAVNPAPEGSSVLSTVIVVFGALGTTANPVLVVLSITTSVSPLSFFGRVNTATGALSRSKVGVVKLVSVVDTLAVERPPCGLPLEVISLAVGECRISSLG